VVIQQNSRKLLMMDILMSETCWAHKKLNKIASDIKLVFYSSATRYVRNHLNSDADVLPPKTGDQSTSMRRIKTFRSTTERICRGADKSLARSGRKQANVSVRMTWISIGVLPCKKKNKTWWQLASRCCWNRARPWHASELLSFMVELRGYQHPGTTVVP